MSSTFQLRPAKAPAPLYPAAIALLAGCGPALRPADLPASLSRSDTGDTSEPGDTGSSDTGTPWEHVITEEEAWGVVQPLMAEQGYEAIFDTRPLRVGAQVVEAHPTWHDQERWQLLLGFEEGDVPDFLATPEGQVCAVYRNSAGLCEQVSCGGARFEDAPCAALGLLPIGGWDGEEDALALAYAQAVPALVGQAEDEIFRPQYYGTNGCTCAEGPTRDSLPVYALLCGVLGVGLSCRRRRLVGSRGP